MILPSETNRKHEMTANSKTILITGSTDGLGRAVAERLAASGATLLVHGRDRQRGDEIVETIKCAGGTARFYQADFSSLAEVRDLAERVGRNHTSIDTLVNNAGIGVGRNRQERQVSKDGHELRFAVNYLAGFLLSRLLLPLLTARPGGQIVNVSSVGQERINFADVMLVERYDGRRAYCQSKLAQIMFTFDLSNELRGAGVSVACLHPATFMDTTMVKSGRHPASHVRQSRC